MASWRKLFTRARACFVLFCLCVVLILPSKLALHADSSSPVVSKVCCRWDRHHIVVIYEHDASRYVRCARRDTIDNIVCMPVPRSAPVMVVVNVGDARRRRDHGVDSIELTLTATYV